jgi:hypothetical protein
MINQSMCMGAESYGVDEDLYTSNNQRLETSTTLRMHLGSGCLLRIAPRR